MDIQTTFEDLNLNNPLRNAIADLGFEEPTTIQQKVFPVMMSGKDVIGIAQTGTGKTMAYLMPVIRLWKYSKSKHPQTLIIVPTRELVAQVVENIESLAKYTNLKAIGVYGGVNMKRHILLVEDGADIVVATPGRLLDLCYHGVLKLKEVRKLIVDEVDEMLHLGFRSQLTAILDLLPSRRQNLLFSATLTDEVEALIHDFFNNPEKIEAAPAGTPLDNIRQIGYEVPNFNTKLNLLEWVLENEAMTRVLIFAGTKRLADQLAEGLEEKFPDQIGVLHSNKAQNTRFHAIRQFQSGDYRIMISTDIMSRGLDISDISHVVNFDLPDEAETYIHRIGRTGRAEKEGQAITFITEKEEDQRVAIETLMDFKIPIFDFPEEVEISTELTALEMAKPEVANIQLNAPKIDVSSSAYHEKKEKNKKVNVRKPRGKGKKKGGKRHPKVQRRSRK